MGDRLVDVTREIYEAFNRGDMEVVLSHMDPEIEVHDRDRTGRVHHGPDGWRAFIEEWMENWDSYTVEIEHLTRNGDRVFIDLMQAGVGMGSGIEFSERFHQVLTFRADKVVRFAIFVDRDEALAAAGLEP